MTDHLSPLDVLELPPEPPPGGPVLWLRENLFSSVGSGVLSVVSIVIALFSFVSAVSWGFAPDRRWDAVTANLRLLMVQSYPQEQIHRVWISVGIVFVLIAAMLAWNKSGGKVAPRDLAKLLIGVGIILLAITALLPDGAEKWQTVGSAWFWGIGGVVALGGGLILGRLPEQTRKAQSIPIMGLVGGAMVAIIVFLQTATLAFPIEGAGPPEVPADRILDALPIAKTTANPWMYIFALTIATFVVVSYLRTNFEGDQSRVRRWLTIAFSVSLPVIALVILRDPQINSDTLVKFMVTGAVFAVLGAFALLWFGSPEAGEARGALASIVGVVAFVVFAFPGILPIPDGLTPFIEPFNFRILLAAFALFALAAPTFGGAGRALVRYAIGWAVTAAVIAFAVIIITTVSTVDVQVSFFIGGLGLTFLLSITAIVLSFPLGVLLALGRTSSMPIFRMMSTVYIEVVRGVPLITWLLVAVVMLPVALPAGVSLSLVMRALIFMTLFSAAYLAENVRGGLQAVGSGQAEAAKALGMTTLQMTVFITLPQALRAVIPALVGQVIAIFKDTSLVTIVGLFDFLHIARQAINQQSRPYNFIGVFLEPLIFAAFVYWMFTFTVSRMSQRLEKKLGVGER